MKVIRSKTECMYVNKETGVIWKSRGSEGG